ncbi:DNA repair protein RAD16 [Coemansia sp. RSA 552]|nr:DNA repair protein RAD16 [Coemansia sp. RSA 552]
MSATPLLPFQRLILDELLDEDALCIVARGLGLNRILAELARICATSKALVFLLHASEEDEADLHHHLMQMRSGEQTGAAPELHVVTNEVNAAARSQLYRGGGLISATSRILIVDLLNQVVPTELVTGVIVHNASRVSAESVEAFVLRVIRNQNSAAFVKALSDSPEAFTMGFATIEKSLKVLGLRHVHLWPRFHVAVQRDLSKASAPVVELRQPQTRAMVELQQAVLDCLSGMISELCSATKVLDSSKINVESSLFRYFDYMVKWQLNPYWHRLSGRTRGMVGDLPLLRRVTELITMYDSVSLLRYLDTLLLSSKPAPGMLPGPATAWMASDSANILYSVARARAFTRATEPLPEHTRSKLRSLGLPDNIVPVLEVPPKLELLAKILEEIGVANAAAAQDGGGPVLVMAGSGRECWVIREFLASLHDTVVLGSKKHPRMMVKLLRRFFEWKARATGPRSSSAVASQTPATASRGGGAVSARHAPAAKRRRVRGGSAAGTRGSRAPAETLEQESSDLAAGMEGRTEEPDSNPEYLDDDDEYLAEGLEAFDEHFGLIGSSETVVVGTYGGEKGILQRLRPTHVVMYEPDAAFIRQVETYQAQGGPLQQVYFIVYDNSVEEQRYLSAIRREREAFERLISDKAHLVVTAGDMAAESPAQRVAAEVARRSLRSARSTEIGRIVVDMREFRAPLPGLLYGAGIQVTVRTLQVGDYVVHDGLVVERKSLADLIASLRSGRLFSQAEAMTRHYATAALLIEFEINSSFSLAPMGGLSADVSVGAITSQLTMLVLAFPRLGILWSASPYETVGIFAQLKQGIPDPDATRAVAVGQDDDDDEHESMFRRAPTDLLQSLPGVTHKNYQALARRFRSMRELCSAPEADLAQDLGQMGARKLHEFLHKQWER